jgi:formyltetrahydrofolate-dependent phosphoribosylglycinamide formyltransferase
MAVLRLGVLVSGSGTTLQNFLDREKAGTLDAEVACVVSSEPKVGAIERAKAAKKPCAVVPWSRDVGIENFSAKITRVLDRERVDLVVMAGFLRLYRFPQDYLWRVMNIHPALLPSFGGKGMYGHHVHEAVAKSGAKVTGCTVHFADYAYDRGPIIVQSTCPVRFEDTPETIAARVFELEKEAYPEAVGLFARRKLKVKDGRVQVLP